MDTPDAFLKKVYSQKEELFYSLTNTQFYVQLVLIGIALTLAGLIGILIRKRVASHLQTHPPRKIDKDIILRPLALLGPVLALLYLSVVKPFVEEFAPDGKVIQPVIQLCVAYMIARIVVVVLRERPMAYFIALVIMVISALDVTGFMKSTTAYLNSLAFEVGKIKISMLTLIQGGIILVIVFWVAGVLSRTLESYLRRSSSMSYSARELIVKFFRIFVYFTAFLITLSSVGVDLTAFAVFGGALGVGIGLGLQKITANFVSGITMLMEKSIQIGDLIEIGNITGWVRQMNIRYMLVETSDSKEVLIPNEELVSSRVINWTHSNTRARIDVNVGVAYGSDPRVVREILLDAAIEHPKCLRDPAPNCFLRNFGPSSLDFLLSFWIEDVRDGRYGPQSEVMISILDKFNAKNIQIPFPQQEVRLLRQTTSSSD